MRSRNGDVIALGHNGNLVNTTELRDELIAQGVKFSGTTDTEVITALIAHEAEGDLLERACARPSARSAAPSPPPS